MPIVHRNTISIKETGGKRVDFVQVTKYDSRSKKFYIALPEPWAKVIGETEVSGETDDKAQVAFLDAGSKFEELTTQKKKVIIYSIASSAVLGRLKDGTHVASWHWNDKDFERVLFRSDSGSYQQYALHWAKGTALDIYYRVCYRAHSDFEKHDIYLTEENHKITDVSKDLKEIDWTAEREAFFVSFDLQLTELIYRLHQHLFENSATQFAQLVDQFKNFNALPAPKETTTDGQH